MANWKLLVTFVPKREYSHRRYLWSCGLPSCYVPIPHLLEVFILPLFSSVWHFFIFFLLAFSSVSSPLLWLFRLSLLNLTVLRTMCWVSCSCNPSMVFIGHFLISAFQYLQEWHGVALGMVNNFWWLSFLQILFISKMKLKNNWKQHLGALNQEKWTDAFTSLKWSSLKFGQDVLYRGTVE